MATVNGTSGNDSLNGTSGNDTLNGLGGNDTLAGSAGTDRYDGGTGSDTLDLRLTSAGVTLSFVDGTISGSFNGTFVNMERVLAGNGADNLIGSAGSQNLSARGGNDTLAGAAGVDTLWGGSGADSFVYRETGAANADSIADFASGVDKIVLNTVVMGTLGEPGNFAAGDERFVANSSGAAQEADDRVIYETDTRQVWFDPDGTGIAPRELIATLQSGATLVATDIVVQGQGGGGPAPIVGTDANESLTGTNGNDIIDGRGGNDTLRGLEGADSLSGGDGNDVLWSNDGPTTFRNPDGAADTLDGGLGDDEYNVDGAEDIILADPGGIDLVIARGPSWTLGEGLDNLFLGTEASDGGGNELDNFIVSAWEGGSIHGLGGNDKLQARGNNFVTVRGGDGDDTLLSSPTGGANLLIGDAGNDLLVGNIGPVTMTGGAGTDTFLYDRDPTQSVEDDLISDFGSGADLIRLDGQAMPALGGSGTFATNDARFAANATGTAEDTSDRVVYNTTTGDLWYDADGSGAEAAARLFTLLDAPLLAATDIEVVNGTAPSGNVINGTSGNDTLTGTAGDETINGLGGNDTLVGSPGSDFYDGGTGADTLDFRATSTGTSVNFTDGTISGGFSGTFTNMERVLAGNAGDTLIGGAGGQTLSGRGGFDSFEGRAGADTLWGGAGDDDFIFREMGSANADRISDFASGADDIMLDDAAFTAVGAMGNFAAGDARFKANSGGTATETDDRVVFNTNTGQLYYDADGSGAGTAQLIGTVQSGATVAATDIVVI